MGNVKIKQFSDKNKELIAGLTPEHAVYDVKGVRLDAKIGSILDIKNTVATQGKNLDNLTLKVNALAVGIFYGYRANESELPQDITENGYAYVGIDNPYKIYNFDGTQWKDSGTTIQATSEADEEDITYNENDKLTFKDRDNIDGMGYVILRKNKSFAEQVINENTIYEIRYNFTLSKDITIPKNCILKFNGGSISGAYTITGTNTGIQAGLIKIFSSTITLDGKWNIKEIYPEWFGAIGNGTTDDTLAIQKTIDTLNITNISTIYLVNKYLVSAPIIINRRRIVVKGSINRYEDFSLIVGDTFTPATIDGKVVKAVLALTKPIDIYNIGINGNKKANCIQWYDGWSAGVIENCQLAGGIGAGIAGFVTETLYIRNNFIHDCPIGIRISRFYFTVDNDTDYSIFGIQSTNPDMGDFYCIEISGNVIECTGINIFLSNGCAVNIINNLTAHSQIWGYYLYELHGVRIEGNYSEGEGVCAADGFTNVSGVDVLGATSQALIDNNLNGVALSATECVRAQSYMFDCHEVTISNTYLSYKKHSNKLVANEFDFDNTKAGIDSHVIWDYSDVLNIDNTQMNNWNADQIAPYTGDECAIFDVAFKRMFPVLNIRHITDIPIFAMENMYYGPSVKLRIEHENMGNIVDMTANKWSTSLSYTPTAYTQSFAEMPVTLVKTLGAHKYYKFNSNTGAAHFSIDIPNIKRRSSKDYIQVMLPYINNSTDDRFIIDTTTYNAGVNIGTTYFRDNYGKGMGVLIAILPIDIVCEHTDLCIHMFNGNGYNDMSFCVPTINYVGCEEVV